MCLRCNSIATMSVDLWKRLFSIHEAVFVPYWLLAISSLHSYILHVSTAYRTLKRGFVYVTPQMRLSSGELAELADFKISLKHPVRSVMELCLSLSTQQAVLPVLLTLLVHAKHSNENGERNSFIQVRRDCLQQLSNLLLSTLLLLFCSFSLSLSLSSPPGSAF